MKFPAQVHFLSADIFSFRIFVVGFGFQSVGESESHVQRRIIYFLVSMAPLHIEEERAAVSSLFKFGRKLGNNGLVCLRTRIGAAELFNRALNQPSAVRRAALSTGSVSRKTRSADKSI